MCHMLALMRVRVVISAFMTVVPSWPVPLVAYRRTALALLAGGRGLEGKLLGVGCSPGMITMWRRKWAPQSGR